MTIYGFEVQQPHSCDLTREQALTVLKYAVEGESFGLSFQWDAMTLKQKADAVQARTGYRSLKIEDVNNGFRGQLTY